MAVTSITFALLVLALLFTTPLGGGLRRGAILAASLVFLGTALDGASACVLATLVLGGYVVSSAARGGRRALARPTIALLVVALLVVKKYEFLYALLPASLLDHGVVIVGASYILFRQVQVLVDAAQGELEELDLVSYVAFVVGFWTLLAGPIQRYQEFLVRWRAIGAVTPSRAAVLAQLDRVATGYFKLAIVGNVFLHVAGPTTPQPLSHELLALYVYPLYVYFNFSGYCDVVIGLAAALGHELPENFDRPYLSRNVLDFWNRWHITLSTWIKTYIFNPLARAGLEWFPRRKLGVAAVAYFVTFFLAGVWHGATANFAVFGMFHAVGAAATKLYDEGLKRWLGRDGYKRYHERIGVRVVSTVLTLQWTALSLLFCRRSLGELHAVASSLLGGAP